MRNTHASARLRLWKRICLDAPVLRPPPRVGALIDETKRDYRLADRIKVDAYSSRARSLTDVVGRKPWLADNTDGTTIAVPPVDCIRDEEEIRHYRTAAGWDWNWLDRLLEASPYTLRRQGHYFA
jgi:hypothetical protein